jgi:AcrR family transcriptional regulator
MATSSGNTSARRPDGRLARSESSRAKIVAALLEIVGKGETSPGAAQIAEVAGVGLRSVFRHFDDMDSLFREMSEHIEAKVLPIIAQPLKAEKWKDRVRELAARRVQVFEAILPYRITANIKRFQSPFLMEDYRRLLRLEQSSLEAVLPDTVLRDAVGAQAINAIFSFQTWRLLRHDQQLSVEAAQVVLMRLVDAMLAEFPDA